MSEALHFPGQGAQYAGMGQDWAEAHPAARRILEDHADELELLGQALLEHETLSADEVRTVIKGGSINRDEGDEPERPAPPRQGASVPTTEGGGAPGGATPEPQPGS